MAVYVLVVKFIYSEKAKKFCKIFTLLLSYVVSVKSKMKISQNFVAFSEYMNFKIGCCWMKEEDIPRLHLHISERAVANHNSYDLISGKNVLGLNTYLHTTFAGQSRYRVEKARIGHFVKVQIFWEDHKNLPPSSTLYLTLLISIKSWVEDGVNFCGVVRIYELYHSQFLI